MFGFSLIVLDPPPFPSLLPFPGSSESAAHRACITAFGAPGHRVPHRLRVASGFPPPFPISFSRPPHEVSFHPPSGALFYTPFTLSYHHHHKPYHPHDSHHPHHPPPPPTQIYPQFTNGTFLTTIVPPRLRRLPGLTSTSQPVHHDSTFNPRSTYPTLTNSPTLTTCRSDHHDDKSHL